jgi:dolichol-phosphate mannosyltransferase
MFGWTGQIQADSGRLIGAGETLGRSQCWFLRMGMRVGLALAESAFGRLVRRYAQFCVVGGSGVVVDMALIYLLASPAMLGWNLSLSKAIAAEVAIFNNFVGNEFWTFRGLGGGRRMRNRLARLVKFNLICLAGIGWSVLLLNVQVYGLGLNVYLANLIAIVLVSLWNFLLNLRFGWKGQGCKC